MSDFNAAELVRQRLVALAMIGAPVLLALGSLLVPGGVDSKADTLRESVAQLQMAGAHRGQVFLAFLLHVFAGLLLIPAVGGLTRLVQERGAALATIGGVLAGIGAGFIAALAALFGLTAYFATATELDPAALAQYQFVMKQDPGAFVLFFVFLLFPLGMLLLVVGLLRARTVPGWQPWLLLIATVVGFFSEGGVVGAAGGLPLVVALTMLALRLWQPHREPGTGVASHRSVTPAEVG